MGNLNTSLGIDPSLLNAAITTCCNWSSIGLANTCKKLECRLEADLRKNLNGARFITNGQRSCCSLPNADRFDFAYDALQNEQWSKPLNFKCSNDMNYQQNGKHIIVELKIADRYMEFLSGRTSNLSNPVPRSFYLNAGPNCTLNAPITMINGTAYFARLAEGVLWHDIVRLKQAHTYFNTEPELYLVLYSDFIFTAQALNNILDSFDLNSGHIYHQRNTVNRSMACNFDYNYTIYPLGTTNPNHNVTLVRIR